MPTCDKCGLKMDYVETIKRGRSGEILEVYTCFKDREFKLVKVELP
jgi:hypothetical protein